MGGTGVAFISSAAAVPINPALLDKVNKYSITLDVFGIGAQPTAPYTITHLHENGDRYQSYDSIRSKPALAPLPFLGAAYRLHPRLVLALAVYPIIGQGTAAKYRPAPDEFPNLMATNKARMGLVETGEALSIRLLDNLSIALMWRISYMIQDVSTPIPGGPPAGVATDKDHTVVKNADIHITGINFYGFQFGLHYTPIKSLQLGFTYRNRVNVWGKDGTTTVHLGDPPTKLPTEGGFNNPHSIRAGFAWTTLHEKLLLALDFKYLFYASAFKQIKTIIDGTPQIRDAYWINSAVLQLGAEYKVHEKVPLRVGYTVLNSATQADYAIAFGAPPGISHLITGGLGLKALDSLDLDLAGSYVVLDGRVTTKTEHNDGPGIYSSHGGMISVSATYHK
jgi:long-subunit fatty acid transport protein